MSKDFKVGTAKGLSLVLGKEHMCMSGQEVGEENGTYI